MPQIQISEFSGFCEPGFLHRRFVFLYNFLIVTSLVVRDEMFRSPPLSLSVRAVRTRRQPLVMSRSTRGLAASAACATATSPSLPRPGAAPPAIAVRPSTTLRSPAAAAAVVALRGGEACTAAIASACDPQPPTPVVTATSAPACGSSDAAAPRPPVHCARVVNADAASFVTRKANAQCFRAIDPATMRRLARPQAALVHLCSDAEVMSPFWMEGSDH